MEISFKPLKPAKKNGFTKDSKRGNVSPKLIVSTLVTYAFYKLVAMVINKEFSMCNGFEERGTFAFGLYLQCVK